MGMNTRKVRFKVKRQLVALMVIGIPIISSFQNCGPNNMDFDVDQPALVIDAPAPIVFSPSEPVSNGGKENSADDSDGGSFSGNGSSDVGAGDKEVASHDPQEGVASDDMASDGGSAPASQDANSQAPISSDEPISEEQAEVEADKSDDADLNEGLTAKEIADDDKAPKSVKEDQRSKESTSYICRVQIPNSKKISTVKYKDGQFNSKGLHYRNRPFVVCMSEFSCEELVGKKLKVHKVKKKKFCERETKKRIVHMTREDVIRFLGN